MPASGQALKPNIWWRVIPGFPAATFLWMAVTSVWPATDIIVLALSLPLAFATTFAAVIMSRRSVWVDLAENRIHVRILNRTIPRYGTVSRSLEAPTTVRFSYESSALGDTFGGMWKGTLISPGEPDVDIAEPWIPDIEDFARLLQPTLMANPRLPADDLSRRAIEDPSYIYHLQA